MYTSDQDRVPYTQGRLKTIWSTRQKGRTFQYSYGRVQGGTYKFGKLHTVPYTYAIAWGGEEW